MSHQYDPAEFGFKPIVDFVLLTQMSVLSKASARRKQQAKHSLQRFIVIRLAAYAVLGWTISKVKSSSSRHTIGTLVE